MMTIRTVARVLVVVMFASSPLQALATTEVNGPAVWRVTISEETPLDADGTPSAGILSRLRHWLKGQAARPRPPLGTTFIVHSSAYAPSPYQTDATPCVTAAGTRVRPGVVASNFLPMGTILDINGERYIVEDRMNPRYQGRFIDIWFPATSDALEFGRQRLEAEIVGYGTPGQDVRTEDEAEVEPDVDADPDAASDTAIVASTASDPGVLGEVGLRIVSWTRQLTRLIGANVNRYDVDCFIDEPQEPAAAG